MSASLVGSEMCIRDRRSAIGRRVQREAAERQECEAGTRRYATLERMDCLLYTSDAARRYA
eukprot:8296058-Alexandrium_andersonii.AAC.1